MLLRLMIRHSDSHKCKINLFLLLFTPLMSSDVYLLVPPDKIALTVKDFMIVSSSQNSGPKYKVGI